MYGVAVAVLGVLVALKVIDGDLVAALDELAAAVLLGVARYNVND